MFGVIARYDGDVRWKDKAAGLRDGMAKAGVRPIVDIYSTFLQRSFDHIFQEVALQNLPVTFMLDRAGLTGPDGPTHHGIYAIIMKWVGEGVPPQC